MRHKIIATLFVMLFSAVIYSCASTEATTDATSGAISVVEGTTAMETEDDKIVREIISEITENETVEEKEVDYEEVELDDVATDADDATDEDADEDVDDADEDNDAPEVTANAIPGKLQLNLKEGSEFRLEFVQTMVVAQEMDGQAMEGNLKATMGLLYEVVEITHDGNYRINITPKYLAIESKMGEHEQSLDSRNGDEIKSAPTHFAHIIDEAIEAVVTPRGIVEGIENADELTDSVIENMEVPAEHQDQIRESYDEEMWRIAINGCFVVLPEDEVDEGGSWEHDGEMAMPMKIATSDEYELSEVDGNKISIEMNSEYEIDDEMATQDQGPFSIETELEGEKEGSFIIDLKTGFIIQGESESTIDMTMTISMDGQDDREQSVDVSITETIRPFEE